MYTLLIVFFLLSIGFSLLCSLWEAVLLSIPPSYVAIQSKNNSPLANTIKSFKDNVDKPLAAILTLNTIAHTVGAIGVGVQANKIWGQQYPIMTSVVVPVLMTLAILILSEIIPKTIGANNWEALVPFTIKSLKLIIFLLFPLVWFAQIITKSLKKKKIKSALSRSEFLAMAEIGAEHGVFEEQEFGMLSNLMRFKSIQTEDIMTPRTVVHAASEEMTIREFFEKNPKLRFSRIPIYSKDSKDEISSYFLKDTLLEELVNKNDQKKLSDIKRNILAVKEDLPLPELFEKLLKDKEHISLVVDEFGGMAGIVSMEDVIETILGMEIVDESDSTDDMRTLARKKWEARAKATGLVKDDS